jgi:uncharacterized protein
MSSLKDLFGVEKPLIAMCHLDGLPGRPRYDEAGGIEAIVRSAARELAALQDGGVDAILFCNENDIPYSTSVPVEAVAAMANVIGRLRADIRVPFGTNLLWDPAASLAIGASKVALFANITPEFSRSVAGRSVAERAAAAAYLGVDALLISGPAAGVDARTADLREAKEAADIPVLANTGVKHETVEEVLSIADGAIVGTSLKVDGNTWNRVDPERVREMMRRVRDVRQSLAAA